MTEALRWLSRLGREAIEYLAEFVAEKDRPTAGIIVGTGVFSAFYGDQKKLVRQAQRRQELAQLLQHLARFQPIHGRLILHGLGREIGELDLVVAQARRRLRE